MVDGGPGWRDPVPCRNRVVVLGAKTSWTLAVLAGDDIRARELPASASVVIASNNVAEYFGLVAGLKAAFDIDRAADVAVRLESNLLGEQMTGRWKIKHEDTRRLELEDREVAADLSAAGGSVTYTWVPRAENSAADALASSAMR